MATIEQVKVLMRMHFEDNEEKFKSIALQIAAHEAKIGHATSAREIKDLIRNPKYAARKKLVKYPDKCEMLEQRLSDARLFGLILSENQKVVNWCNME